MSTTLKTRLTLDALESREVPAAFGLKSALPSAVPVPLGAVRVAAPAPGPTVVPAAQVVLVVASARQVEPGPKLTPTSAPVIPPLSFRYFLMRHPGLRVARPRLF